jgi:hypothetical protein
MPPNTQFFGRRFVFAQAALFFLQTGLQKMRELYIFCLEGGLMSSERARKWIAQQFDGFIHQIKVRQQIEDRILYKPSEE